MTADSPKPNKKTRPANGKDDVPPNPFDPARLRLSADYAAGLNVKRVLTTVPCRKPNRHEWIRVRPGEEWQLETAIFEDKDSREFFLVERPLVPELLGDVVFVCLYVTVNRQNDPSFWPVKLPDPDGRRNAWHDSAIEAAQLAQKQWIRIAANMTAGYYDVHVTTADLPDPQWPDMSIDGLLEIGFRDRFIRDRDHVALKRLRGEL